MPRCHDIIVSNGQCGLRCRHIKGVDVATGQRVMTKVDFNVATSRELMWRHGSLYIPSDQSMLRHHSRISHF